jgi:hypothetical protein
MDRSSRRTGRGLAGAAVLSILSLSDATGGALWTLLDASSREIAAGDEARTTSDAIRRGQRAPWVRSWEPGLQYVHALEYIHDLSSSDPTAEPALHLVLRGELTSTVVGVGGRAVDVESVLRASSLEVLAGSGPITGSARETLRAQLEMPFYVSFDRRGAVQSIHLEASVSSAAERALRSLVGSLQVVLDPSAPERWSAQERDASGGIEAFYRRVGATGEIERTRVPAAEARVRTSGRAMLRLDERLWIQELRASERSEIQGSDAAAWVGEIAITSRS